MDISHLMNNELAGALFIFCARIIDVSIGTIRIILISRGYRYLAPLFGFFEVLIWIIAITQVMKGLGSVWSYLAYASGFATGNYVGMLLEAYIAIGYQSIRIITNEKVVSLPLMLRDQGFGATVLKGWGAKGEVTIVFTVVPRKKIGEVLDIVKMFEPDAFITIEDVKERFAGYFIRTRSFTELFARTIPKKK